MSSGSSGWRRGGGAMVRVGAILPHGRIYRHTLCLGALSPGSRNCIISPMPWPNFIMFAVPSSSQRVLQLWSNRTWLTWLLFGSRKWPSKAFNHHFFPLRGLDEGCALWGARNIFIDLGGGAPKMPIFPQNWLKFGFSLSSPLATTMLDGLRTPDP